jgi:hypothetical protein
MKRRELTPGEKEQAQNHSSANVPKETGACVEEWGTGKLI